jgi:hypothetical protein
MWPEWQELLKQQEQPCGVDSRAALNCLGRAEINHHPEILEVGVPGRPATPKPEDKSDQ